METRGGDMERRLLSARAVEKKRLALVVGEKAAAVGNWKEQEMEVGDAQRG